MIKHKVKILEIVEEAEGTKTFYMEKPEELTWEEGSHIHIGLEGFDEGEKPNRGLVHHMSICTLPTENRVGFTTRVPGSHSEFKTKLDSLRTGKEVTLFKSGGRMGLRRNQQPVVLISMGVGIATMRPIIHQYLNNPENITELMNINIDSSGKFIFQSELDSLESPLYKNYWIPERELFYKILEKAADLNQAVFYIVGSDKFLIDCIERLKMKGVKTDHIILDKKEDQIEELLKY